jgi:hypothetical protein
MRLYDPTSSGAERHLSRAPPLASLAGLRVGILHNHKLNAPEMLSAIAVRFERQHGCKVVGAYSKTNASAPAPKETLERAAKEVDFLITGLGD